jgi:hypothetical protein
MQITCACGSDRFKAGEVRLNPAGGFDIVMPCSACHQPVVVLHGHDPAMAGELIDFFRDPPTEVREL